GASARMLAWHVRQSAVGCVPLDGYDLDDLGVRVGMVRRALERGEGPLYDVAVLLDALVAARLATLAGIRRRPPYASSRSRSASSRGIVTIASCPVASAR